MFCVSLCLLVLCVVLFYLLLVCAFMGLGARIKMDCAFMGLGARIKMDDDDDAYSASKS